MHISAILKELLECLMCCKKETSFQLIEDLIMRKFILLVQRERSEQISRNKIGKMEKDLDIEKVHGLKNNRTRNKEGLLRQDSAL